MTKEILKMLAICSDHAGVDLKEIIKAHLAINFFKLINIFW